MYICESTLIIELSIEQHRLIIGTTTYLLDTSTFISSVFFQSGNHIRTSIIRPNRLIGRIVIINTCGIAGVVVNGKACGERQTFQNRAQISTNTQVKLQLTWSPSVIACSMHRSKRVGLKILCTTEQILTINDIVRVLNIGLCRSICPIHHRNGYERNQRILAGWSNRCRFCPIIGIVVTLVIESSITIHPSRQPVTQFQIDITTNVQTSSVVVFTLTKTNQVIDIRQTNVGIEVSHLTTTTNFNSSIVTLIGLIQIIAWEEIQLGITIGIVTNRIMIDILIAKNSRFSIVSKCLIIKRCIHSRTQVFRITLRNKKSSITTYAGFQSVITATLSRDENCTVSSATAIKNYCLWRAEERNLLNLRRQYIIRITGHTIY